MSTEPRRYGAYTMPDDYQADAETVAILEGAPETDADAAEGELDLDAGGDY